MLSETAELFLKENNYEFRNWLGYKQALQRLHKYEVIKNVYEFSRDELLQAIVSCSTDLAPNTIVVYISKYSTYFEWIETNTNFKFPYEYKIVLSEAKKELEDNLNLKVLSRKELYDFVYTLKDKQQAILPALIFEGVQGERIHDVTNIKPSDLEGKKLTLPSRVMELPEDLLPIFKIACSQKRATKNKHLFYPSEFLIKNVGKSDISDRNVDTTVRNRLYQLRKHLPDLSSPVLRISGMLFYLSVLEQVKKELTDDDYYQILIRYNCSNIETELSKLKVKYRIYKESEKYDKDINISSYYNIYSSMLDKNSSKKMIISEASRKLGLLGEVYIYNLLKEVYGENNVKDNTKYGTGYDYLVTEYNLMYEVKSTSGFQDDEYIFYMTIGELRTAVKSKSKYVATVVYFENNIPKEIYEIENPIDNFGIARQACLLLELDNENICTPTQLRITIPYELLDKYLVAKL